MRSSHFACKRVGVFSFPLSGCCAQSLKEEIVELILSGHARAQRRGRVLVVLQPQRKVQSDVDEARSTSLAALSLPAIADRHLSLAACYEARRAGGAVGARGDRHTERKAGRPAGFAAHTNQKHANMRGVRRHTSPELIRNRQTPTCRSRKPPHTCMFVCVAKVRTEGPQAQSHAPCKCTPYRFPAGYQPG